MTFKLLSQKEFINHTATCSQRSFMQTVEMAELLQKRGFRTQYVGYTDDKNQLVVSAVLYTMPMTGGLHMEINCGPVSSDQQHLAPFYQSLQSYAKENGALELVIKPYETYQSFDSAGNPLSPEKPEYITTLTALGYHFDGLQTGYPGGEPDWHYVKDLSDITESTLVKTFTKSGKATVKKANTFGIKLHKLKREELQVFKDITTATSERREYDDKTLEYYQDFFDAFGPNAEFMVASLNFQDYLTNLEKDKAALAQKLAKLEEIHKDNPDSAKFHKQAKELHHQLETFTTRITEAHELIERYGSQDKVLAASLFVYTPQEVTYLFSGSYPEFNKFYAPALLQEYAMKEAIRRQIPFYNFLGIMGVFDGSDGVLRFKHNFNGYIVRKMGTFRYYPNLLKFKLLQLIKKILRR